jgi:hypothetical protein
VLQLERKIDNILDEQNITKWKNREDILMAAVFGTALYLPFKELLGPILKASKPINDSKKFPCDGNWECTDYSASLWPSIKKIQNSNPDIINIISNLKDEPDGFCQFQNELLIIEAKKPSAHFGELQLTKYIEALSGEKELGLWLLAVGKGPLIAKSISEFSISHDYNILYIDWTSIDSVVKKLASERTGNIKFLYEDLSSFLDKRSLKSFEGFVWPKNINPINSVFKFNMSIKEKWFPIFPPNWPISLMEDIKLNDTKILPWTRE